MILDVRAKTGPMGAPTTYDGAELFIAEITEPKIKLTLKTNPTFVERAHSGTLRGGVD